MTTALRADCANCLGLCCVALAFTASADFAVDKAAGEPCANLRPDHRCGVHAELRPRGFAGCTVYDCFGAGQKLSATASGWSAELFAALPVVRQLHELLWYLEEALALAPTAELRAAQAEALRLADSPAPRAADVDGHRAVVGALLQETSSAARAGVGRKKDRRGADLIGASLPGAALRGASLRGAYLIGADLRGADLRLADVLGADFRDADVRGADLGTALFLTQTQANACRGDARTRLPHRVSRPAHWG